MTSAPSQSSAPVASPAASPAPPLPLSLMRTVGGFLLTRGVNIAAGFVGSIVVTRGLRAEGRGLYALILSTVLLLSYGTSLGVAGSNTVLVGRRREWAQPLLLRNGWLLAAAVLPLFAVAALWPQARWPQPLADVSRPLLLLALGHLLLLNLVGSNNAILLGLQRFTALNALNGGLALLSLLLQLLFVLGLDWGVAGALLALLGGNLLGALVATLLILRPAPAAAPSPGDERLSTFAGLAIGLRGIGVNLVGMLLLRVDVYLVDALLGHRAVGVYTVGVLLAEQILQLPSIMNSIFFAKSASDEPVVEQVVRSSQLCALLGLLTCCGFALLGRPFLRAVYGGEFVPAYPSALLVMVGVSLWAFASPMAGFLAGKLGYPRSLLLAQLAGLVVNVGVNLLAIPRLGLVGAGLATAVGYGLSALCIAYAFAREGGLPWGRVFRLSLEDRAWLGRQLGRRGRPESP